MVTAMTKSGTHSDSQRAADLGGPPTSGATNNPEGTGHELAPELDYLLQNADTPAPPARLIKAVLALPEKHRRASAPWVFTGMWRPLGFTVAAVTIGFFLGQATMLSKKVAVNSAKIDRLFSSFILASDVDFSEFEK